MVHSDGSLQIFIPSYAIINVVLVNKFGQLLIDKPALGTVEYREFKPAAGLSLSPGPVHQVAKLLAGFRAAHGCALSETLDIPGNVHHVLWSGVVNVSLNSGNFFGNISNFCSSGFPVVSRFLLGLEV